jgi:hypothetical protein
MEMADRIENSLGKLANSMELMLMNSNKNEWMHIINALICSYGADIRHMFRFNFTEEEMEEINFE